MKNVNSGNDAAENIGIFMEKCYFGDSIHFIVKRNIRKENPAEWLENFREVCTNVSNFLKTIKLMNEDNTFQ